MKRWLQWHAKQQNQSLDDGLKFQTPFYPENLRHGSSYFSMKRPSDFDNYGFGQLPRDIVSQTVFLSHDHCTSPSRARLLAVILQILQELGSRA